MEVPLIILALYLPVPDNIISIEYHDADKCEAIVHKYETEYGVDDKLLHQYICLNLQPFFDGS